MTDYEGKKWKVCAWLIQLVPILSVGDYEAGPGWIHLDWTFALMASMDSEDVGHTFFIIIF